jgi:D-alanine-D-alanine ligase
MSDLRIAVLANLRSSVKVAADAPPDVLADFDSEETVQGVQDALRAYGHTPFFLEADETFLDTVRERRPDLCFNIAEGLRGDSRESHIPALLEMLAIPYTGSKVLTHSISLDKAVTKQVWRDSRLPTGAFQCFRYVETALDPQLAFPLFVKPVREGTGMGINARSIVNDEAELRAQVAWVIATYHQPALVETYLPGREFTVGLMGNTLLPGQAPPSDFYDACGFHVLPVLEIDAHKGAVEGLYNAEAKSYAIDDEAAPGYLCPADIPVELEKTLKRLAVRAFEALGSLDVARVDFRMGADGQPYLMEINTLPGLNPVVSDMTIAARAEGTPYERMINEILDLARRRYGLL